MRPKWLRQLVIAATAIALLAILGKLIFWPPAPMVVLVLRHAERDDAAACSPATIYTRANSPIATLMGLSPRAQALAHVGGQDGIVAIYASEFCRTQQTVQPLATQLGLGVTLINQYAADGTLHVDDLVDAVKTHKGQVVLVAGHSDSVPAIIEKLGGSISPITENEFDNLYVVTIPRWFGRTKVVRLKYGSPPP